MIKIKEYTPPISDKYFKNIEYVLIYHENIVELPYWLLQCTKVRHLNISNNNIKNICNINGLVNLEYLNLSANPIKSIYGLNNFYKLRTLMITDTKVESLLPLPSKFSGTVYAKRSKLSNEEIKSNILHRSMNILTNY